MALTKIQGPSANSLILSGVTTANGNETVNGTLLVQGTATINAAVTVNGSLTVSGSSIIPSPLSLLHAASGTDTTTSNVNVDTVAISGLTAKDSLIVYITMGSTTQGTTGPRLYNSTDSVDILSPGAAVGAGSVYTFQATVRQRQTAVTAIVSSGLVNNTDGSGVPFSTNKNQVATFVTSFQGSWTLAFRHNGVTAGGTFDWSWAVYKLAGQ